MMDIDMIQNIAITLMAIAVVLINLRQDKKIRELEIDADISYDNNKVLTEVVDDMLQDMQIQTGATQSIMDEVNQLNSRVDDMLKVYIN